MKRWTVLLLGLLLLVAAVIPAAMAEDPPDTELFDTIYPPDKSMFPHEDPGRSTYIRNYIVNQDDFRTSPHVPAVCATGLRGEIKWANPALRSDWSYGTPNWTQQDITILEQPKGVGADPDPAWIQVGTRKVDGVDRPMFFVEWKSTYGPTEYVQDYSILPAEDTHYNFRIQYNPTLLRWEVYLDNELKFSKPISYLGTGFTCGNWFTVGFESYPTRGAAINEVLGRYHTGYGEIYLLKYRYANQWFGLTTILDDPMWTTSTDPDGGYGGSRGYSSTRGYFVKGWTYRET